MTDLRRYASAVSMVAGRSAIPYGYTVTVWTSGAAIESTHGTPTRGDAFLFLIGAIAGYSLVGLVARAENDPPLAPEHGDLIRTGLFHLAAVCLAFGAAALCASIPGVLAWPVGAFAATLIYLTVAAAELVLAARHAPDR
jgi:hypothetical protein